MINHESFEYPSSLLSEVGTRIVRELHGVLSSPELSLSSELRFSLTRSFAACSPVLLNHLGLLDEIPAFKTNGKLASQFSYEIAMIKRLLMNEVKVRELLSGDNQLIVDLVFAILISDVGKAGLTENMDNQPSLVIQRIFNQAIFTDAHKEWLKKAKPTDFPDQIRELIEELPETDRKDIFEKGVFFALPIEAYLHVIKQVALGLAKDNQDLTDKAENLFTLTKEEQEFLLSIGVNPMETPTRSFFTNSHIRFGRIFLNDGDLLNHEQKEIVPLALSHHLSQSVLPKGVDIDLFLSDQQLLRKVAFLEILDKFDAFYSRFKEKDREAARESTWKIISNNLSSNYEQYPELADVYKEIFDSMVGSEII